MRTHVIPRQALVVLFLMIACGIGVPLRAQERETIALIVEPGRPLRVSLDKRVRLAQEGQVVTGTVIEPVHVYDRIVVPAGAKVTGHIARLEGVSKSVRVGAVLGGDFTPLRRAAVAFDELIVDGRSIPIRTGATGGIERVQRVTAPASHAPPPGGARGRAGDEVRRAEAEVKARTREAIAMVTRPGKMARLRDGLIGRLPYHPQYLAQGTIYDAELREPVEFGRAVPIARAPEGSRPAPSSLLKVLLTTTLDSKETARGAPVAAVLTEPVLSSDRELVLPQGTVLRGSVTQSQAARHFRKNGKLRFLFERVERQDEGESQLLASLHSVETSAAGRLAVDDEGGATITNSKTRFIAPAIAIAALTVVTDPQESAVELDEGAGAASSRVAGRGAAGALGLGVAGLALGYASKPVALGLGVFGATRAVYSAVFGKGSDVKFDAGTPLQLQLSPRSVPAP